MTGLKIRYNYTNAVSEEITLNDATIGDFTFNPARWTVLSSTPQTINVQVTHKGNLVNDTFAIYVGDTILKLKLTPSTGGTFGAGLNDSISFTNITDFDNSKTLIEGQMAIGWKQILNDWYYFTSDGSMLVSSITPDGYVVGADGKYIQQ